MNHAFQARIAALPDAELIQYLAHFQDYRTEAVAAALAELDRRGLALPAGELARIRAGLTTRAAAAEDRLRHGLVARLGPTLEDRLRRIRQITAGLLAAGLGGAVVIYLLAAPGGPNPLGFEPEDSKKYLRDMEVFGGKVNVLAAQLRAAWSGLWHGRSLAFTVAGLTLVLALAVWFLATHRARGLAALGEDPNSKKTGMATDEHDTRSPTSTARPGG
jgi:hypothetical protein